MSPSYRIVFYVSGHGFGHSSRIVEVIRALQRLDPAASITVKTSAPKRLYDGIPTESFQCDTGMVQFDSLHLDEAASLQQARAFHASLGAKAAMEASFLKKTGARLVVGDIPPLAFAAAADAAVPSIAIGNFTWDWIYEGYRGAREAGSWIDSIRLAYRNATLALRLPMAGGFGGLEHVTRDIPFVARHSKREPADVRRWLDVPEGKAILLMSFGGYGLAGLDTARLAAPGDYAIVTTDFPAERHGIGPAPGLIYVSEQRLRDAGYHYEDLVRTADVVLTKPGYGIISECIANDTAILYTSRGHFPEYDVLVREMPKYLRAQFIEQEDLLAGRWAPALEKLWSSPKPALKPDTNGAQAAADAIRSFL
jgi:hypothetical protein